MDRGGSGVQRMRDVDRSLSSSAGNKWGNTYGLSPQFLESLSISSPLVSRVFVANVSGVDNHVYSVSIGILPV